MLMNHKLIKFNLIEQVRINQIKIFKHEKLQLLLRLIIWAKI